MRAAGKAKSQRWVNVLLKPGLATQLIIRVYRGSKAYRSCACQFGGGDESGMNWETA